MGTTVATNALLERKGEACVLVTTQGLEDAMLIGTQARPFIFSLSIIRPEPIVSSIVGVKERILVSPTLNTSRSVTSTGDAAPMDLPIPCEYYDIGSTGEPVAVLTSLDEDNLRHTLHTIYDKGIRSLAVSLMHSYTYNKHELIIERIAKEIGFTYISLSSTLMPTVKLVPRTYTACADAYLTPCIKTYLNQFLSGFDDNIVNVPILFMQSDGGLVSSKYFSGYRAVLSGPAGGVVGYSQTAYLDKSTNIETNICEGLNIDQAVIGFDMGGTSTDVSRYHGQYEHVFENTTAGVIIQAPQLDISTVAAGGGSILDFSAGLLSVGPESASAYPGPTCYRNDGPLTTTDANVILGRIQKQHFPEVFGPSQNLPLDDYASFRKFISLVNKMNTFQLTKAKNDGVKDIENVALSIGDAALGFVAVANEAMSRPIRSLTESRGYDPSSHALACFGSAGGQHACAVATSLGIKTIHIHQYSGVLSAFGIGLASVSSEKQTSCLQSLSGITVYSKDISEMEYDSNVILTQPSSQVHSQLPELQNRTMITAAFHLHELGNQVRNEMLEQGILPSHIAIEMYFSLRYHGTDTFIMISIPQSIMDQLEVIHQVLSQANLSPLSSAEDIFQVFNETWDSKQIKLDTVTIAQNVLNDFNENYSREYGFNLQRDVLLDTVRVRAVSNDSQFCLNSSSLPMTNASDVGLSTKSESILFDFQTSTLRPSLPEPINTVLTYYPRDEIEKLRSVNPGFVTLSSMSAHKVYVDEVRKSCDDEELQTQDDVSPAYCIPDKRGVWCRIPVYNLAQLPIKALIVGPASIVNATSTILVDPLWCAVVNVDGIVLHAINITDKTREAYSKTTGFCGRLLSTSTLSMQHNKMKNERFHVDPVLLSIFSHRFMSIAEQMGRVLQRTSVSTNIKERLDFSCALFGPDGGLVANAPHLPVHLGAMQEAIRSQIELLGDTWLPGDVIVTNHPNYGGSHLPDITVITPVFIDTQVVNENDNVTKTKKTISFFVASRGHHSDVGGSIPGSMPPFSTSLEEEGVAIASFKLVDGTTGIFDYDGIAQTLQHPKHGYGARNVLDNLSDLQAQVAANHRGVLLLQSLVKSYGLSTIHSYMDHIRTAASDAVKDMLCEVSHRYNLQDIDTLPLTTDYMDDGTPIKLRVTIDRVQNTATFDFTGTGSYVHGNTNSPRSVTLSAIIYSLRCMVSKDIPLNQGCLAPVKVIIPDNTILSPPPTAAVVGGNVLTSQRVTDVILKAFNACAASQGCMNNFCFGNDAFGYYETIAGGAGAGPTWNGASAVHTHMTNTRITDPEVLERRYSVLLRQFSIRKGSGGRGQYRGGDGVKREVQFLRPMTISLLTERRKLAPFGLNGGEDAKKGENYHVLYPTNPKPSEYFSSDSPRTLYLLDGKVALDVKPCEGILICTPGGGGWGHPDSAPSIQETSQPKHHIPPKSGSLGNYAANQESA